MLGIEPNYPGEFPFVYKILYWLNCWLHLVCLLLQTVTFGFLFFNWAYKVDAFFWAKRNPELAKEYPFLALREKK